MTVSGQFLVVNEKRKRKIKIAEIMYCESDINYTTIHLHQQKKIVCARTIKVLHSLLTAYGFVRTHQTYLINQAFIQNVDCEKKTVELSLGLVLPISRRNLKAFAQ